MAAKPFSKGWVLISLAVFIGAEIALGVVVGELVVGRYVSHNLRFMVQGILHVSSFFVGGFIIGFISPGVRITEPAVAAFIAVGVSMVLTLFTPYTFIRASMSKLIIGGVIAYALALAGARLGERLTGNRKKGS